MTLVPATVHTGSVVELKLTARPEEAVAPTVTGESARVLSARAPKVIVWSPLLMVKLWLCWGAGVVGRVAGLVGGDRADAHAEERDDAAARDRADARRVVL